MSCEAVALRADKFLARVPEFPALCERHGISLRLLPCSIIQAKAEYPNHRNIVTWGLKESGAWFDLANHNVLFTEQGLLGQTAGTYVSTSGRWGDSHLAQEHLLESWEFDQVRALHGLMWRVFGWAPEQVGNPSGPVLVALQVDRDFQVAGYSRCFSDLTPTETLLKACRTFLPAGVPVLVRPHPKAVRQFRRLMRGKRLPAGWSIQEDGRTAYETLKGCRGIVAINSTLLTETACSRIPAAAVGGGPFSGTGAIDEGDSLSELLGSFPHEIDREKRTRFVMSAYLDQVPAAAEVEDLERNRQILEWLEGCHR